MKSGFPSIIFDKTLSRFGYGLVLFLFIFVSNAFAVGFEVTNYQQCWKYETDKLTNFSLTVNPNDLISPLSDASLINLDSATGNVNWKAELGGEIAAPPVSNGKIAIAVTRTSAVENSKNTNFLTLRALSASTGLTIWQKNFSDAEQVFLVLDNERLLFVLNKSGGEATFQSLETNNGNSLWSKTIPTSVSTRIFLSDGKFYFGTKNNFIHLIRANNGESIKQYQVAEAAQNNLVAANGIIFYGSANGDITAIREADFRQIWKLRTGGAVQSILLTEWGMVVTSLDNFVYMHKYSNGKRQWRRRLSARPLSAGLLNQETAILLVNGESSAVVLELRKGKILNQIQLGENNYAVAQAEKNDKLLFIPTFNGILCLAANDADCGKSLSTEKEKSAN